MGSEWTAPPGVAALTRLRAARAEGVRLMDELSLLPELFVHPRYYVYRSAWMCSAEDHRDIRVLLSSTRQVYLLAAWFLRRAESSLSASSQEKPLTTISPWPLVRQGDQQHPVQTLQYLLRARGHNLNVDGIFGPQTGAAVRAFQQQKGLAVDGVVGPATWAALVITVRLGSQGDAVRGFQQALHQDIPSVTVDGIVGPVTWQALVSGMLSF